MPQGANGVEANNASAKRKKIRTTARAGDVEVFAYGEDTLVCRLQASLTICGRDMQHTACGILPGEEMIDVINTMRNACRKLFPERQYSRPPVPEAEKMCFLNTIVYI